MTGAHPDLLFQRYFEAALPPYEADLLGRMLLRGGALVDRFVELRELERALSDFFGGARSVRDRNPSGTPESVELPGFRPSADDPFRARRFPECRGAGSEGDCAGEILAATLRRFRRNDPESHRRAVTFSMGLLCGEPREALRCRYGLGLNSGECARRLSRSLSEMEELILRSQRFLAGCVRLRLARSPGDR